MERELTALEVLGLLEDFVLKQTENELDKMYIRQSIRIIRKDLENTKLFKERIEELRKKNNQKSYDLYDKAEGKVTDPEMAYFYQGKEGGYCDALRILKDGKLPY